MDQKFPQASLEKLLENLKLNPKEAKILLTSLQYGSQPASVLARKSSIPRSSVFFPLKSLIRKGLMMKEVKSNISYFRATSVETLQEKFQEKIEMAQNDFQAFKELLPSIEVLDPQKFPLNPRIIHFEGIEGIKKIYNDILETDSDLYIISGYKLHTDIRKYLKEKYLPARKQSGKNSYIIINDTPDAKEYLDFSKKMFKEIYLVPEELYSMNITMRIYGNKLAIISANDEDFTGIIIENQFIAEHMRTIFKMLSHFLGKTHKL